MSTLSAVRKSMTVTEINPATHKSGDLYYFHSDGTDYKIEFTGHNSSLKAFLKCPPLSSIIKKKAQAFINGKTWILNKKGKGKEKEAQGEIAKKVRALLDQPNPFQSQREFEAQLYTYLQLFGWSIVIPINRPVGMDNYEAKRLWNIPPSMVNVEETKKNWLYAESNKDLVKKLIINWGGEQSEIPLSDCYIFKDSSFSFGSPLFPESRTKSIEYPINNIIGAYESRGKLIDYRGALGIISPDSKDVAGAVPLRDEDKTDLQNEFLKYGLKRSQYNYIISTAAVKWTQMGIATKDLMLFEEIEDDIMRICDEFNYPYPLMSSNRTNSLGGNNIYEAKKLLYQDAIIPEADGICEQWNKFFNIAKSDMAIEKDFSHIAALQDDEQKKALARKTRNEAMQIEFYNNLCTLDDWRIANGDDPLDNEFGKMYYYQLLKEGWLFGSNAKSAQIPVNNEQNTETAA